MDYVKLIFCRSTALTDGQHDRRKDKKAISIAYTRLIRNAR